MELNGIKLNGNSSKLKNIPFVTCQLHSVLQGNLLTETLIQHQAAIIRDQACTEKQNSKI